MNTNDSTVVERQSFYLKRGSWFLGIYNFLNTLRKLVQVLKRIWARVFSSNFWILVVWYLLFYTLIGKKQTNRGWTSDVYIHILVILCFLSHPAVSFPDDRDGVLQGTKCVQWGRGHPSRSDRGTPPSPTPGQPLQQALSETGQSTIQGLRSAPTYIVYHS